MDVIENAFAFKTELQGAIHDELNPKIDICAGLISSRLAINNHTKSTCKTKIRLIPKKVLLRSAMIFNCGRLSNQPITRVENIAPVHLCGVDTNVNETTEVVNVQNTVYSNFKASEKCDIIPIICVQNSNVK